MSRLITIVLVFMLAACGRPEFGTTSSADENVVETDADRQMPGDEQNPTSDDGLTGDVGEGANNVTDVPVERNTGEDAVAVDFPFAAYGALTTTSRNALIAPHGLARSLVIAHAAVSAEQAETVASALQSYLGAPLYDGFNEADLQLEAREQTGMLGAVWAQEDVAVEEEFVDTLARYVGLRLRLVDFQNAPEDTRTTINNWYSDETGGRISEVIGPRGVDAATRLTITDATWFSAPWAFGGFDPTATDYRNFAGTESDVQVPMMVKTTTLFHVAGSDFDAVLLPIDGDFSVIAVLPDDLAAFEQSLNADFVERLVDEAQPTAIRLGFPRIEVSDRVRLSSMSSALGLEGLFDGTAEYTAFADGTTLDDAHQRTRIMFSETGVEAMSDLNDGTTPNEDPSPPVDELLELTFDRPFFFAIRDSQTGTLLFMGRVAQP
jgi:serpin B